jgi:hypothetical protein
VLPRGSWQITPGPVVVSLGNPIGVAGRSLRERDAVTGKARDEIAALRDEARDAVESR